VSYRLIYLPRADKAIKKLDPSIKPAVKKAIEKIAERPESGKPLSLNFAGLYSWRAGDYRVIYRIDKDVVTVLIVSVGHRREVYDKLKSLLER
jgi:mRNA interferase RelE/StbE